nr:MAG TPA: hypothetical protein [Crassvirales sp.]
MCSCVAAHATRTRLARSASVCARVCAYRSACVCVYVRAYVCCA